MEANITIIPEDYDDLKKEYVILRKEMDNLKQELYGSKRQIQLLETLKLDYQGEIDLLQSKESDEKHVLEDKILSLEESYNNFKIKCREERQSLENRLLKFEEENCHLNTEIDFLKNADVSNTSKDSTNNFIDEILELKEENDMLQYRIEEIKISLETLQEINLQLEETVAENNKEITELKESIACKNEELSDSKDLIQKLQEEMFCLKNELESYKSQPLDKLSKGNSLFAEVDDRRVYLEKTISNMKTEFVAMKQERTRFLNTIHHLKLDNKMFLEKWKADISDRQDDTHTVIKAFKNRIATLEKLIENYKKDLEIKPVILSKEDSFKAFEFYNVMLGNKTKEIEELKVQIASQTLTETLLSQALKQANEEKRNWRLEACLKQKQLEIKLEKDRLNSIDNDREKIGSLSCHNDTARNSPIKPCNNSISDVITIDDTSEDEDVKEVNCNKISEINSNNIAMEQNKTNSKCDTLLERIKVKTEVVESTMNEDEKENDKQNCGGEESVRRVTFAANSESPKKSNIRRCKKVIICKPVTLNSIQRPK